MRSNRSCSRARTTERGFALVWAAGLSLLFFMLVSLVLIDSARELAEARRFRARIVATVLAENGAELAAVQMTHPDRDVSMPAPVQDWQGTFSGEMRKNRESGEFTMVGEGETRGTVHAKARVEVKGTVVGNHIQIHFTVHKP